MKNQFLLALSFCLFTYLGFCQNVTNNLCDYSELTKLIASNGASNDYFGTVAIDGNKAVVGAYGFFNGSNGKAYIYEWDGLNWQETLLTASDGAVDDWFGFDVAISGNRVVVGAIYHDSNMANTGSIYIYEWDGLIWQETKITASDNTQASSFGTSVSISGDRIIVGAQDIGFNGVGGRAYIYEWDGLNWQETVLASSDGVIGDKFGSDVSISGDRAVVSAIGDDDNGTDTGSIYIYEWNGSVWQETKIVASDGALDDRFGYSVSISGDRVVVGASLDDDNGSSSGSVYIYEWNNTTWHEMKLTPSDATSGEAFGSDVAIMNDLIIVGAWFGDTNITNTGSAYVFKWDGNTWQETKIIASDGASIDHFGINVAISDSYVIVGADYDDDNGNNSGSAYIFEPINCCPTNLYVSDNPIPDGEYIADDILNSDKIVPATGLVTFNAGNQVCLDPGFEVIQGAVFEAYIQGCSTSSLNNGANARK